MDGGHVHGLEAVRAYWTRQWSLISPHVEPMGFRKTADGAVVVDVRQTINDLEGKPRTEHGLKDKTVGHVFHFRGSRSFASISQTKPDDWPELSRPGRPAIHALGRERAEGGEKLVGSARR